MASTLMDLYNAAAREVRKINRVRRFNRGKAMKPLLEQTRAWWNDGLDALFAYMGLHDGWEKLQQHMQLAIASEQLAKAMTDSDRAFLANLLANFGYFGDRSVAEKAKEIIAATSVDTFEAAATFALRQLGVADANFELRNEAVRDALLARQDAAIFATRSFMDETFQTITNQFYELGRHPYDSQTIEQLRGILGYKADWEAQRFALTETGIAAELAQIETYRRNGVTAKQWNTLDVNTRPSHAELAGAVVGIDQKFDCGGFAADHPLDPKLPASEICNCHCWLSPVLDEGFEVDPTKLWEGE